MYTRPLPWDVSAGGGGRSRRRGRRLRWCPHDQVVPLWPSGAFMARWRHGHLVASPVRGRVKGK